MYRRLFFLFAISASLVLASVTSVDAAGAGGHRGGFKGGAKRSAIGRSSSFGHGGFGQGGFGCGGFGCGGFGGIGGIGYGGYNDICGYAELYRQLYNNLPYFALHPPVYYSYPVPRTYGYSPFAYPPYVMTPDHGAPQPLEIINPHVDSTKAKPTAEPKSDRTAGTAQVEPLVVINPYVVPTQTVAHNDR